MLPTPKELIQQLNKLLFKFLWKGTDQVKRVSVINEYEEGGLRMIDIECMVKSLGRAWLRRIFKRINGPWKSFLQHLLSPLGGFFSFFFFFFLLAITTYLIKQFLLNSIMNSCLGGQSSVRLSPQKRIGQILFGITVKLE